MLYFLHLLYLILAWPPLRGLALYECAGNSLPATTREENGEFCVLLKPHTKTTGILA